MDIEKVVNFPFPTPPDMEQLCAAERRLLLLGALEPPPRNVRLNRKCDTIIIVIKQQIKLQLVIKFD